MTRMTKSFFLFTCIGLGSCTFLVSCSPASQKAPQMANINGDQGTPVKPIDPTDPGHNPPPASSTTFSYPNSDTINYAIGISPSPLVVSPTTAVSECTSTPAFSAGITLDPTTCHISIDSTQATAAPAMTYIISGSNSKNETLTAKVTINITTTPQIKYPNNNTIAYTIGDLNATSTTVSAILPTGFTLNNGDSCKFSNDTPKGFSVDNNCNIKINSSTVLANYSSGSSGTYNMVIGVVDASGTPVTQQTTVKITLNPEPTMTFSAISLYTGALLPTKNKVLTSQPIATIDSNNILLSSLKVRPQ